MLKQDTTDQIMLVIRLSVDRLPVKLPITGCIFKLQIIDLQTFFFSSDPFTVTSQIAQHELLACALCFIKLNVR